MKGSRGGEIYVKPLIRLNSLTWITVSQRRFEEGRKTHDLAALVLDVLLGLIELVGGGILCEGDLEGLVR
jgi:hypothetical protein